jgi:hypothetical protein
MALTKIEALESFIQGPLIPTFDSLVDEDLKMLLN